MAKGQQSTQTYDILGRPKTLTTPEGVKVKTTNNEFGEVFQLITDVNGEHDITAVGQCLLDQLATHATGNVIVHANVH